MIYQKTDYTQCSFAVSLIFIVGQATIRKVMYLENSKKPQLFYNCHIYFCYGGGNHYMLFNFKQFERLW